MSPQIVGNKSKEPAKTIDREEIVQMGLGDREAEYLSRCVSKIEMNLEAFGILAKVREITIEENYYEYLMEVAVGTSFTSLERRSRELSSALATTGKIKWRMTIPGRALVGLQMPKPPKEYFEALIREEKRKWEEKSLKNRIAFGFYLLGKLNYLIASKILGKSI